MSFRLARLTLAAALALGGMAHAQTAAELAAQREAYDAVEPKTTVALQPFRHETAVPLDAGRELRLVSTNPAVNAWFLLRVGEAGGRDGFVHIENPDPEGQTLRLSGGEMPALVIEGPQGASRCTPWLGEESGLAAARATGLPFAPICGGRLYLRNAVRGSRTNLERTTEFLRENVWGGEQIVRMVRDNLLRDREMRSSETLDVAATGRLDIGPGAAAMDMEVAERPVLATLMDLALEGTRDARVTAGLWYPVAALDGVYASAIQPRWLAKSVLEGPGKVNWLDNVERRADVYMVAIDMSRFDIGYAVGTDHPALGWSPRPPASVRPRGMPGPDGVSKPDPLVPLGMVSPALAERTIATFTGGFKRSHGAFKWGEYIGLNYGTHYGFVEQGTVLSKLWPHLSTLYVLTDGTVGMKTWTEADAALLPRIRFARQNGVPLIEDGVPGPLVPHWGPGNWSGSAKAELRTLRAGACMKRHEGKPWLIYAYFSSATPSAMARTFQGYGCDYAMLLDMNALEHTYLALYVRHAGEMHVEHMVPGMGLVDKKAADGTLIPRFLGFVDNRDLFYLTLKEGVE